MDSADASVAGAQGRSSSIMTKKKQVGNAKLVSRSVFNNTQKPRRMLANQFHSQSLMWSYQSNWSDYLSPQHILPPSAINSYQSQLGLGCLGTANSRTEAPLFVPEMPSPNIPNRESRPMGFGRGRGRGVWAPQVIVPQHLVVGEILVEDSLT